MANNSKINGMLLGAAAGAAGLFVVKNVTQLDFIAGWVNKGAVALMHQSWMSSITSVPFVEYSLAIIAGILVGLYVESR